MLQFLYPTMLKIIRQPAIIVLIIIELSVLFLILFFVHCEYDGNLLVSISIFGKTHEIENITNILINTFLNLLWSILIFLYIIGTASLFTEFFCDPLLPVYLTKRITRASLLIYFYINVILTIFVIQFFFLGLLNVILYIKTGTFYWIITSALVFGPALMIALLVSFSAFVSVIFEKVVVSFVIVLIVYFLQPFLHDGYAYVSVLLKIGIALFPPVAQVDNYFLSLLKNMQTIEFPFITFIYITFFIGGAIFIFQKKDIS